MPSSPSETPPLSERVTWTITPPLVRSVARVAWRLEVDLGEGLPDPPFVIAANHHSFLDAFLIGAVFDHKIRFLALDDLFGNYRLVDFILRVHDVVLIKRGHVPLGPMREALAHLTNDGVVGLFPEGTRHWEFEPTQALPGAAWLAIRAGVPLVPVALRGTDRVLGVDNRLHAGRVGVLVGPKMHGAGTDRPAVDELTTRWARWVAETLRA